MMDQIIDQLLEMFGTRLLTEMNALARYVHWCYSFHRNRMSLRCVSYGDQLEGDLMGELENGRIVRLMAKLGFINERPE